MAVAMSMFSHVNIGANDVPRMIAFYDAVLATLGITRVETGPPGTYAGWRRGTHGPVLYVGKPFDARPATPGNGCMVALAAPDPAAVDAMHRTALALGGTTAGEPGPRPYRPGYYGAYVHDPEGNKLHAVHLPAATP